MLERNRSSRESVKCDGKNIAQERTKLNFKLQNKCTAILVVRVFSWF